MSHDDKLNVNLNGEEDNLNVNAESELRERIRELEESRRKLHSYNIDLLQSNLRNEKRIRELEAMLEALEIPKVPQTDEFIKAAERAMSTHKEAFLKLALSERDEKIAELEGELNKLRGES